MSCLRFITRRFSTQITWDDTVPFIPPIRRVRVIKVYDGDTITIASRLPMKGSEIYRWSVRLRGIDCPELKSRDIGEKACAEKAQAFLSNLILGKKVLLKNIGRDKYGRLLADVYHQNKNLSRVMLNNCLAVEYDGGKKESVDWLELFKQSPGL